ncbi:thiamine pyrophosphate-binding protein [Corynebacterium auriscanis]|uniref:thiamine pyrophosphate-binding protein n=2 Tax=Corynebacterium auriscanis TaxID=99807 RepID=UPI0024ACDE2F|nr:thiamine pyrophosphate-binding protein [Corynebacterium auriscanis]
MGMLVAEVLADYLVRQDVAAFGVVGNGNIHMVSAMVATGGKYTAVRHEAGAVAAADAYYRASGTVAVATTTYGPGFSNALTPLTEAHTARVPLVYVTADIPTTGPRPIDINQRGVLDALGIRYITLTLDNVADIMPEAFSWARRHSAPVVVMVAHDLCDRVVPDSALPNAAVTDPASAENKALVGAVSTPAANSQLTTAAASHLGQLADQLRHAHRPLFVIGRGAVESGTQHDILHLADTLGALVCTTAWATNCVETEWSLGIAGGFAHRGRLELFRAADLVVVCGASLNKLQSRGGHLFGADATLVRIDSAPSPGGFIQPDQEIQADLAEAVPMLLCELGTQAEQPHSASSAETPCPADATLMTDTPSDSATTWRDTIGKLPECESEELDPGCFAEVDSTDGRLDPRFVLRRLDELLPQQRSIVTDGGHFLGWVPKYLTGPDHHGLVLVGSAIMTIGLGLPSAVGVAAARPERFTALITGDGGCLMAAADVESFLRAEPSESHAGRGVIILNDAAYGAEVHQYSPKGLHVEPMLLDEVQFAQLGAPFGVEGITITAPEQLAEGGELAQFLARKFDEEPNPRFVVDVRISRGPVADFLKEL